MLRRANRRVRIDASCRSAASKAQSAEVRRQKSSSTGQTCSANLRAQPVLFLVALFDAAFDLAAFVNSLADVARQFDVDGIGNAVFLHDGLHLLHRLDQRLARNGAADQRAVDDLRLRGFLQRLLAADADIESVALAAGGVVIAAFSQAAE